MSEVRFSQVEGPGLGREYPVGASTYFHRLGGKFVDFSGGSVCCAASGNTKILGWAEVPKDTSGADSWASSSTTKKDKVFVVYDHDAVFEMPFHGTASMNHVNVCVGIVNGTGIAAANTTVSATTKQHAKAGSPASPLRIVDVDTVNNTVFVKINRNYRQ